MVIQAYESERIVLRDVFRVNFASLSCIRKYFDLKVDIDDESSKESNILFGFLELHLSDNFWNGFNSRKSSTGLIILRREIMTFLLFILLQ